MLANWKFLCQGCDSLLIEKNDERINATTIRTTRKNRTNEHDKRRGSATMTMMKTTTRKTNTKTSTTMESKCSYGWLDKYFVLCIHCTVYAWEWFHKCFPGKRIHRWWRTREDSTTATDTSYLFLVFWTRKCVCPYTSNSDSWFTDIIYSY
jgi:hypothetical protein